MAGFGDLRVAEANSSAAQTCDFVSPNFSYSEETFKLVSKLAPLVKEYSRRYSVPPIPVAGSVADEFNTRTGMKGVVDWIQDEVLINWMPSIFIEVDARLGFNSKLLNATKHDIGVGNIKVETAKQISVLYKEKFQGISDWSELVDYIRSEEGTVHIAALVIKRGLELLEPYMTGLPEDVREAVLVTYYKQGESYLHRFLLKDPQGIADSVKYIKPGEGCRVLMQRERFKTALGL